MIKWLLFLIFIGCSFRVFADENCMDTLYLSIKKDLKIREGTLGKYEGLTELDSLYWFAKGEVSMLQRIIQQIEIYENKEKDLKMKLLDNNN